MNELLKFYALSIIIIVPIFGIIVRLIFKKSFLSKIGYVLIYVAILVTITNVTIEYFDIPIQIGIPIRLIIIISGILFLKKDIKILQKQTDDLDKISNSNLNIEFDDKHLTRNDELGAITKSLKKMTTELSEIIRNINDRASSVFSAANQLSSTAQQMSQGSNEQAASVEEVSSSMEQMSSNIEQNTDNAQQTDRIASKAVEEIVNGNKAVNETIISMKTIVQKVRIINEIANKIDLLAINAAIEAARAGEQGKGFAVVANEVRKLADRSQKAASEIDELTKVSLGIAENTGKLFTEIVLSIQNTAKLVQEITASSVEQNNGAIQINSAIDQLNNVAQQSAAASEELATSAEEMTRQAEQLQEIVSFFKVDIQIRSNLKEQTKVQQTQNWHLNSIKEKNWG